MTEFTAMRGIFKKIPAEQPIGSIDVSLDRKHRPAAADSKVLGMLEELMRIFETLYCSKGNRKTDFNTLIRKKFVQNAERFAFLDPFAAEFEYVDGRIVFKGAAPGAELVRGVVTSMLELADAIALGVELRRSLSSWFKKYDTKLHRWGIRP